MKSLIGKLDDSAGLRLMIYLLGVAFLAGGVYVSQKNQEQRLADNELIVESAASSVGALRALLDQHIKLDEVMTENMKDELKDHEERLRDIERRLRDR